MARESKLEEYFKKRVTEAGGETRKVKWIGHNGAPDRRVMLPQIGGRKYLSWVELKAPDEKPEEHQKREHARLRHFGEEVYVIDSYAKVDHFVEYGYV